MRESQPARSLAHRLVSSVVAVAWGALALASVAAQSGAPASTSGGQRAPALLTTPAPAAPFRPAKLEGWEALECAGCHTAVAEEWSESAHGLSWVDEVYKESLVGKRRPQSCYACHIPEPLLAAGALERRARPRPSDGADAHFGVRCQTCHLGPEGTILGPFGAPTDAHASVKSPQHLTGAEAGESGGSSALCSVCHATNIGPVIGVAEDFQEAGLAAEGLSCVGCHMAPIERRWANAPGADPAADETAPVRAGRSHLLQTPRDPAFLRLAFGWEWKGGERPSVVLTNQAGHRVPGLLNRFLEFELTSLDASGQPLGTERFTLDAEAYLPVRGTREVPLAAGAVAVEIVGVHEEPRAEKAIEFLRKKLPE